MKPQGLNHFLSHWQTEYCPRRSFSATVLEYNMYVRYSLNVRKLFNIYFKRCTHPQFNQTFTTGRAHLTPYTNSLEKLTSYPPPPPLPPQLPLYKNCWLYPETKICSDERDGRLLKFQQRKNKMKQNKHKNHENKNNSFL